MTLKKVALSNFICGHEVGAYSDGQVKNRSCRINVSKVCVLNTVTGIGESKIIEWERKHILR